MSVSHYENFPVASWLSPAPLRAPIAAIYWFARTADDIADEGNATARARLDELQAYEDDLRRAGADKDDSGRWPAVFAPLRETIRRFELPLPLFSELLSAFRQDVVFSAESRFYANRAELLDYCRRSASPIGRLLLHLYGISDPLSLRRSDCICSALQLVNFWQDLSVDLPRARCYLPADACAAYGVTWPELMSLQQTPATQHLVEAMVLWAGELMREGAPLVHDIPGRAGWELRLVVQGGLRILAKIEAMNHQTLRTRPRLRLGDGAIMLARSLWM
jgi:squalene synthase HpnC